MEILHRRIAVVRVWIDRLKYDPLEIRIDIAIARYTRSHIAFPRPLVAGQHRIEHGAQREYVGATIGCLAGYFRRRVSWRVGRVVRSARGMPAPLIGRFKVDHPDDWPAMFQPDQDIHRIQIDMVDLQGVKVTQRSRDLHGRENVSDGLVGDPFFADRGRQRKLREEGGDYVDSAVAQRSVFSQEREILGLWKRLIDGQQAGDLILEIVLVDEPGLGGDFDQNARIAPFVGPDVEMVPGGLN